jgi:hypothetical protein
MQPATGEAAVFPRSHRRRVAWLLAALGPLLPSASPRAQARDRLAPTLRPTECRAELPDAVKPRVRCFTFVVPRDYDRPADGTFDVAVAVRTAEHRDPAWRRLLILRDE